MKDYFLRAETREQIDQALIDAGLITIVNGEPVASSSAIIDYVGTIHRDSGQYTLDEDGFEVAIMEPIEGYHVNLRGKLTAEQEALLPIIETPSQPQRIFAGGILR